MKMEIIFESFDTSKEDILKITKEYNIDVEFLESGEMSLQKIKLIGLESDLQKLSLDYDLDL